MEKQQIAVLFGGVSSEHGVSLISAFTVIANLNPEKYNIYPIGITKDGRFLHFSGDIKALKDGTWESHPKNCRCVLSPDREHHGMIRLTADGAEIVALDCVIPVLHGKNGEDGTIQGLLQLAGIPFVGCGLIASANCMDKEITHILLERAGVKTARFLSFPHHSVPDTLADDVRTRLGYPVFVKPANAGSSFGVSKASDDAELRDAVALAFEHDTKVIIEEMITGHEVECAVLGNADAKASVLGEIQPANDFYDFEAKYEAEDSKLFIPARIEDSVRDRLQEVAVKAYLAMGCEGLSRVDFFVTDDNQVILNEINTFPGFTSISMYPKLWEASGIPIGELLERLIAYAKSR